MVQIDWGEFMDNAKMIEGVQILGSRVGQGESNFVLNKEVKQAPEPNVEIINDMPKEDLDFIVERYRKGYLYMFERLGEGGNGNVYGYKNYAIKKIFDTNPYYSSDVKVLKDISHLDSVVKLYAVIDEYTLIVERVKGVTLRDYVNFSDDNSLNLGEDTLKQFDKALLDIVRLGYAPLDLHGENVMIDTNGDIKIVDVGFFKEHGEKFDDNEDTYRKNIGYSQAQDLAGSELRNYLRKQMTAEIKPMVI